MSCILPANIRTQRTISLSASVWQTPMSEPSSGQALLHLATLHLAIIALEPYVRTSSLKPVAMLFGHARSGPPFHFDSILSHRFVILGLALAGQVAFGFVRTGASMCLVMLEQRMARAFHSDAIRISCIYI